MKRFVGIIAACLFAFAVQAQQCDSLYVASLKLFDEGNFDASLDAITNVIANCGDKVDYQLHRSKCYSEKKDVKGKLSALNAALAIDSNCIAALTEKAVMFQSAEMYPQAIQLYNKVLSLIPTKDSTTKIYQTNLSAMYVLTNQNGKAFDMLWQLCHNDSLDVKLLTNLSACAIYIGKYQNAEWALQKIFSISKNNVDALINLGFCKEQQGDYNAAISFYDSALAIVPDEAYALNNRGYAKYMLENYKEALIDINKSIQLDPSNSYAYRNKALVLLKTGKKSEVCENLQHALDMGFTQMYGDEVLRLQKENCK